MLPNIDFHLKDAESLKESTLLASKRNQLHVNNNDQDSDQENMYQSSLAPKITISAASQSKKASPQRKLTPEKNKKPKLNNDFDLHTSNQNIYDDSQYSSRNKAINAPKNIVAKTKKDNLNKSNENINFNLNNINANNNTILNNTINLNNTVINKTFY